MPQPGWWENLCDRWAMRLRGGARVRVFERDGNLHTRVLGRVSGPAPDRLAALVMEMKPEGPGTVHFHHDGRSHWRIEASGALLDAELPQRLRNVLVNL